MVAAGFFDQQFRKQVEEGSFELNPFETLALAYLEGSVLDLGAGLGNLALEAGRRGHEVLAVEKCSTAVARMGRDAAAEGLGVKAVQADVTAWEADRDFDTVVVIGLLHFFRRETAMRILETTIQHLRPEGALILNVLVEGTTFMDMFDGENYHLFQEGELEARFVDWEILESRYDSFAAPEETRKDFLTLVVRRPAD